MQEILDLALQTEYGPKITAVLAILGAIGTVVTSLASLTPSKKIDKAASKLEKFGELMNVVGFDLKKLIPRKK